MRLCSYLPHVNSDMPALGSSLYCILYIRLALIFPDAVFLEGMANPVLACATLVLPEDSFSVNITLPDVFVLPVKFTDGTAGTFPTIASYHEQLVPCQNYGADPLLF